MNIIKRDSLPSIQKLKNKDDFVNQIVQYVIAICKEDKSFTINSKLKKFHSYQNSLEEENNRLDNLLTRCNKAKSDIQIQISEIEENNTKQRERLLNQLGSE